MNKKGPCQGCPDRTAEPNCHATCYDRYIPWAQKNKERKLREKRIKQQDADVYNVLNKRNITGHAISKKVKNNG